MTGLSSLNGMDASENETTCTIKYEDKTWYRFRVRVTGKAIRCWVNDKEIIAVDHQDRRVSTRLETRRERAAGLRHLADRRRPAQDRGPHAHARRGRRHEQDRLTGPETASGRQADGFLRILFDAEYARGVDTSLSRTPPIDLDSTSAGSLHHPQDTLGGDDTRHNLHPPLTKAAGGVPVPTIQGSSAIHPPAPPSQRLLKKSCLRVSGSAG